MNDKLDVFEILGVEHTESEKKDQEQTSASGPDFNNAPKYQNVEKTRLKRIKRGLKLIAIAVVILLIFTFVIDAPKVSGPSMEPTLEDGDRVVINLMSRNYEVGDIIVFETDDGDKLIKRIVGIPGDVVKITPDKQLSINGRDVDEEYVYTDTVVTDITVVYPVIVNEGTYFVMGDNRTNSKDSRNSEIGLVNKEDIVGKVILCWRKF